MTASVYRRIRSIYRRLVVRWLTLTKRFKLEYGPDLRILDYHPKHYRSGKRALLYYLPDPVLQHLKGDPIYNFSNKGLAIAWVNVLHSLGYTIDIISWDSPSWSPVHRYDLVVAHGGRNTTNFLKLKDQGAKLVYFATGSYWKVHNERAEQRAALFYQRHKHKLLPERQISEPEEAVLQAADGIISLGSDYRTQGYTYFKHVYSIEIGTFLDGHFGNAQKDYGNARHNFVFFAGGGNLHKGLDLILEAFRDSPHHLYICTSLNTEFEQFYKKELSAPNIHFLGTLELRSRQFYELVDTCAYVILASCAEGSPGSVADCMQVGLIPVVTPESVVVTEAFGAVIEQPDPTEIARLVSKLASLAPDEVARRSRLTYEHVVKEQSPTQYERKLGKLVKQILSA